MGDLGAASNSPAASVSSNAITPPTSSKPSLVRGTQATNAGTAVPANTVTSAHLPSPQARLPGLAADNTLTSSSSAPTTQHPHIWQGGSVAAQPYAAYGVSNPAFASLALMQAQQQQQHQHQQHLQFLQQQHLRFLPHAGNVPMMMQGVLANEYNPMIASQNHSVPVSPAMFPRALTNGLAPQHNNSQAGTQLPQLLQQHANSSPAQSTRQPQGGNVSAFQQYQSSAFPQPAGNVSNVHQLFNQNDNRPAQSLNLDLSSFVNRPTAANTTGSRQQGQPAAPRASSPMANSAAALAQAMQARAESLARLHAASIHQIAAAHSSGTGGQGGSNGEQSGEGGEMDAEDRVITARGRKMKTGIQSRILKAFYTKQPRPSKDDLQALSSLTSLPYNEISRWFRNERHKDKKSREAKDAALSALALQSDGPESACIEGFTSAGKRSLGNSTAQTDAKKAKRAGADASSDSDSMSSDDDRRTDLVEVNKAVSEAETAAENTRNGNDSPMSVATNSEKQHSPLLHATFPAISILTAAAINAATGHGSMHPPPQHPSRPQATRQPSRTTSPASALKNAGSPLMTGHDSPSKCVSDTSASPSEAYTSKDVGEEAWQHLSALFQPVMTPQRISSSPAELPSMATTTNNEAVNQTVLAGLIGMFKTHRSYLQQLADELLPPNHPHSRT